MATFHFHLVAPDKLTFEGEVDQVDVPGSEGDFGVLAGHAPTVALLRPGILTVFAAGGSRQSMVVLGGFAEVADDGSLTVLAEVADSVEKFDAEIINARIGELEENVGKMEPGNALDKAVTRLDHYKTVQQAINSPRVV